MATSSLPQNQSQSNPQIDRTPPNFPTESPPVVDGKKFLEVFLRLTQPMPEKARRGGAK